MNENGECEIVKITYDSDLDAYTLYSNDGSFSLTDFRCDIVVPVNVDAQVLLYDTSSSLVDSVTTGYRLWWHWFRFIFRNF